MTSDAGHLSRLSFIAVLLFSLPVLSAGAADTDWGGTLQGYVDGSNVQNRELTSGFNAGIWSETDFSAMARLSALRINSPRFSRSAVTSASIISLSYSGLE